ncbi:hypothetical protein OK016_26565 [Vibrio chagasii]|nr:hypothetical protein [Vibrio chagasii]
MSQEPLVYVALPQVVPLALTRWTNTAIDFAIAVNPADYESVMQERFNILDSIGGKVAAFTVNTLVSHALNCVDTGPGFVHMLLIFQRFSPDAQISSWLTTKCYGNDIVFINRYVFQQRGTTLPTTRPAMD